MNEPEKRSHLPNPAIEGFLEIAEHAVLGGMALTDRLRSILEDIEEHESWIAAQQEDHSVEDPENQERINAAYYHLGKIAALNALLDIPERNRLGFIK